MKQIRPYLPATYNRYYEPFLGGGALLLDSQPKTAVVNDLHELVYHAFVDCRNNPEPVIAEEKEIETDYLKTDNKKERFKDYLYELNTLTQRGEYNTALFLFLTRACFCGKLSQGKNGLYQGTFGDYAKFNEANFRAVHNYLQAANITIMNHDYHDALTNAGANDFVFLDPPYSSNGNTYLAYGAKRFGRDEQADLAAVFRDLDKRGVKILETNYDTPVTRALYDGFTFIPIKTRMHIGKNANYQQVMICNYQQEGA